MNITLESFRNNPSLYEALQNTNMNPNGIITQFGPALDDLADRIEFDTDIDILVRYNFTPMHVVALTLDTPMLRLLLHIGGNPNVIDRYSMTPFMWAIHCFKKGYNIKHLIRFIKTLLNAGYNVNITDLSMGSALHYASNINNRHLTKLLLYYGSDPNLIDYFHRTPLDVARINGNFRVVRVIEQYLQDQQALYTLMHHPSEILGHNIPGQKMQQFLLRRFSKKKSKGG